MIEIPGNGKDRVVYVNPRYVTALSISASDALSVVVNMDEGTTGTRYVAQFKTYANRDEWLNTARRSVTNA